MKKRPLRNLRQNKNEWERLPARMGWKPFFTSSLFLFCTFIGARRRLFKIVIFGKRSQLWKTIPIFSLTLLIFFFSFSQLTPLSFSTPVSISSRRLIHRRKVLFPHPEGPTITTTSHFCREKETSSRIGTLFTYDFFKCSTSKIGCPIHLSSFLY